MNFFFFPEQQGRKKKQEGTNFFKIFFSEKHDF